MKNVKKNGGFTLVELIVVIAILAILAAVAIPAYSGYIAKAEKAGDLQILGAINTAFASACMNEGFTQYDVQGAMIPVDANGKVGTESFATASAATPGTPKFVASVSFTDGTGLSDAELIAFNKAFALFFSGNETATFKTIKSGLFYDPTQGGFVTMEDYKGEGLTMSYGGKVITVSAEAAKKMQESSFGENLGAATLLGEVNGLTDFMVDDSLLGNDDYMRALAGYLNITVPDNLTGEDLAGYMEGALDEMGWEDTQKDKALANGAVFYAADRIQEMDAAGMEAILTSGDIYHSIEPNGGDEGMRLAQSAMAYGMYAAFVKSDYNKNNAEFATDNPMGALQAISNSENASYADFQKYINSDQGKEDMEAYMAAMSVINDAKGENASIEVLKNGFGDSELEALLGQVLGKQ